MKKKLLITMGCSFTEGMGCFDYSILSDKIKNTLNKLSFFEYLYNDINPTPIENEELHWNNFHEKGWPNRVGKKLGFDKVINIGFRGSSNSAQVKQFYEKYLDVDFSDWDVTIIWLMSFSHRISFYTQGQVKNFFDEELSNTYLKILEYDNRDDVADASLHDMTLEQLFYFKIMEDLCKSRGYQLVGFHYDTLDSKYFTKYYKGNNYIPCNPTDMEHCENHKMVRFATMHDKISGHPTERGYDIISDNMIKHIIDKFPNQYKLNFNDKIEWVWNGLPIKHSRIKNPNI